MNLMVLAGIVSVVASVGCDGADRSSPMPITAPTPVLQSPGPRGPAPESVPNWRAHAVVISVFGSGGCGEGRAPGEQVEQSWRITTDGDAILLDEDVSNWPTDDVPYHGTLDGRRFTANIDNSPDYLFYACLWRGGTLSGEFNADFTALEADEFMSWGPPDQETVVHRHWTGSPLPTSQVRQRF